jgi:hypothetical protein
MDEQRARELRIEEQYPDGAARSGFGYRFSLAELPEPNVVLEILVADETLRFFFPKMYFTQFAHEVAAVNAEVNSIVEGS